MGDIAPVFGGVVVKADDLEDHIEDALEHYINAATDLGLNTAGIGIFWETDGERRWGYEARPH